MSLVRRETHVKGTGHFSQLVTVQNVVPANESTKLLTLRRGKRIVFRSTRAKPNEIHIA